MQPWCSPSLPSSICIESNMCVRHIWSAASLTHIYSQTAVLSQQMPSVGYMYKQTNPKHPLVPAAISAQTLHSFLPRLHLCSLVCT